MTTSKKIRLAWKHRRAIWKYRLYRFHKLYRYRRELGGLAITGAAMAVVALASHRSK
jgi:hypothetical protein